MTAPEINAGPMDLTRAQTRVLLQGIQRGRIQHMQGRAHLEVWDVRRWLTRIFGFGGWSEELLEMRQVNAQSNAKGQWTVCFTATVRLTVRTADGRTLTYFDGCAAGEGKNQKSAEDAYDMAVKKAQSQALKRAAMNLGDQFGLSLYNGGSADPVVQRIATLIDDPDTTEPIASTDETVQPEPADEAEPTSDTEAPSMTAQEIANHAADPSATAANVRSLGETFAKTLGTQEVDILQSDGQLIRQPLRVYLLDRYRNLQQIEAQDAQGEPEPAAQAPQTQQPWPNVKQPPQPQTVAHEVTPDADPATCTHPHGFDYADDGNGHSGWYCQHCGTPQHSTNYGYDPHSTPYDEGLRDKMDGD